MRLPPIRRPAVRPIAALALVALATGVRPAAAQLAEPAAAAPRVAGGLAGGFSRRSDAIGYTALATLEVRTPLTPLRLRVDGTFADWGPSRFTALTGSLVGVAPVRWAAAPYATAGGGVYAAPSGGGTGAGWTLGAGLRFRPAAGGRAFFAETRAHAFRSRLRSPLEDATGLRDPWAYVYSPLVLGVRF